MNSELKLRRGAPYGNQNARKHGFYSRALNKLDRRDLKHAASIEGVDEEIALLRLKLKSVLTHDPENIRLVEQALLSLNRLLRTKNKLALVNKDVIKEAITNVLREVALPIGVDLTKIHGIGGE